MNRAEIRKGKCGQKTAAGNLERELSEIQKLQENKAADRIFTLTVGCDGILTIICC